MKPAGDTRPGDLAGDLEFLYRAVLKLQQMERDLFGKVAPVVADQVEEAMLGKRRQLDTSRAEMEFGFRSRTTFEDGLRETIRWYEESLKRSTPKAG